MVLPQERYPEEIDPRRYRCSQHEDDQIHHGVSRVLHDNTEVIDAPSVLDIAGHEHHAGKRHAKHGNGVLGDGATFEAEIFIGS